MDKEQYDTQRQENMQKKQARERQKTTQQTFVWAGVGCLVVGTVAGMVYLASQSASREKLTGEVIASIAEIRADDHIKGSAESAVTLIEYGDFQCPGCRAYYPLVKQLVDEFGDRIRVVYRHFPLEKAHANAMPAARASEAASMQGKFWEIHDLLFENQSEWANTRSSAGIFEDYAARIGLEGNSFRDAMDSDAVKDRISRDLNAATNARLPGTPTFFLNGAQISSPKNYDDFRALILKALQDGA